MNKSSQRYERFAREYVIDLNGKRAAIAAGYSENGADSKASQLLGKVKVQRLVARLQSERATRLEVKADRVVEELARLAFSNMADYMEIDEDGKPVGLNLRSLTRDQAAAIQEISEDATGGSGDGERRLILRTKFKLADKGANLERLGRHLGMFPNKVEHNLDSSLAELIAGFRKRVTENGDSQS